MFNQITMIKQAKEPLKTALSLSVTGRFNLWNFKQKKSFA